MRWVVCVAAAMLVGCAGPVSYEWTELSPGLRVDVAARAVEFDGAVATDVHDPVTPVVWLELFVTGPNTREHESLVVTRVPASLIHAALLAVGAEPSEPGSVWVDADGAVRRRAATGSALRVRFVTGDGREHDPAEWVVREGTDATLAEDDAWVEGGGGFVFAGSRVVARQGREFYDADMTGVVAPLATFGSGVISPGVTVSHASALDAPVWVARNAVVPGVGEGVVVRVVVGD